MKRTKSFFLTAEYDFNYPTFKECSQILVSGGGYKAGMVSYGGVAAVTRAADSPKADILNSK